MFLTISLPVLADSVLLGRDGILRGLSSPEEEYSFSITGSMLRSVYVVSEEGITLRMFDDSSRLVRETRWSADYSQIQSVTEYVYKGKSQTPSSKTESYPSKGTETEIIYTEDGSELKRVVYNVSGTRKTVSETVTWEYDSRGRISEEKHVSGTVPPVEDKYAYLYNENGLPPDYYVYRNGELLEKTAYVSDVEYWTVIYFGDYEVWTRWLYGEKKEERHILNGVIQRRSYF